MVKKITWIVCSKLLDRWMLSHKSFSSHCAVQLIHKTDMNKIHRHSNECAEDLKKRKNTSSLSSKIVNAPKPFYHENLVYSLFPLYASFSVCFLLWICSHLSDFTNGIFKWQLSIFPLSFITPPPYFLRYNYLYLRTWYNYCNVLRWIEQ